MASSINRRSDDVALSASDNAAYRKEQNTNATKASTGQGGLEAGNRAKRNLRKK